MEKTQETGRFVATDDAGQQYTIIEMTKFVSFQPLGGAERWIDGPKSYRTPNDEPVNQVDERTFKLVFSNKTVRRPEA